MSDREKMIIEFYEDGKTPLYIKLDMIIYKLYKRIRRKINELRSNRTMDTKRYSTIPNDGNGSTRTN